MTEPQERDDFSDRLQRLEARIDAARASRAEPLERRRGGGDHGSVAWRMVTELVVGMGLGVLIGLGIDSLLGTRPVFLVLLALLGFAGGVRAMMRTAAELAPKRTGESKAGPQGPGTR